MTRLTGVNKYREVVTESLEKDVLEKLAGYEDLEEQGLLIKLPCMVGTLAYVIHYIDRGKKPVLTSVKLDEFMLVLSVIENRFGKTVFLTKEEAFSALDKLNNEMGNNV